MDSRCSHTVWNPRRHWKHDPSGMAAMTCTRSPTRHASTPVPTSTTSPATSCPMTRGRVMLACPWWKILTSVPHVPQARTRMTRSPGPASGSGTGSSRRSPDAYRRAVLIVLLPGLGCPLGCLSGCWLRRFLEGRRQDGKDHIRIRGLSQLAGVFGLDKDVGQAGQDVEVRIVARSDTNAHEDAILTPVDAGRELGEGEGCFPDENPTLVRPMRNCEPLSH